MKDDETLNIIMTKKEFMDITKEHEIVEQLKKLQEEYKHLDTKPLECPIYNKLKKTLEGKE